MADNGMLDQIDRGMIRLLQKDGRMPIVALAKELGISETTARTRLKRLIKDEIINVVAVSNPIKLGFEIIGSLKLNIDLKKKAHILDELKKIGQLNLFRKTFLNLDTLLMNFYQEKSIHIMLKVLKKEPNICSF